MRWYLAWLVVLGAHGLARADAEATAPTLSAKDVQTYFAPYVPDVRACYVAHARGKAVEGTLRLELIVRPDGGIFSFRFAAPGVAPPWLGKLDTCLRQLVPRWHFPVRSRFTTALVPFLFQKTAAPDAGPIESCWDPRGCPPGVRGAPR